MFQVGSGVFFNPLKSPSPLLFRVPFWSAKSVRNVQKKCERYGDSIVQPCRGGDAGGGCVLRRCKKRYSRVGTLV